MDFIRSLSSFLEKYASLPPSPRAVKEVLEKILQERGVTAKIGRISFQNGELNILASSSVKHYLHVNKDSILSELKSRLLSMKIRDIR